MAIKNVKDAEFDTNAEEMVEVFVPKSPGEEPTKYVGVNGRAWQIPRGKRTKVPKAVALVLERAQAAQDEADRFSEEEQKKMLEVQGAPM